VSVPNGAPGCADGGSFGRTGAAASGALLLLAASAAAATPAAEWSDLYGRCAKAVTKVEALDTEGLVQRGPTLIPDVVEEPPFGRRIEFDAAPLSARTVPTGIWARPDGRFELTLIEYPTRPGTRAICEVAPARNAPALTAAEAAAVFETFRAARAERIAAGGFAPLDADTEGRRAAMVSTAPNPRGCTVVASVTRDGDFFRSSVAERAGTPSCGGASLLAGLRELQMRTGETLR
jgi:hypothetical protein